VILGVASILVLIWTGILGYDLLFGPMVEATMPDFALFVWTVLSAVVTILALRNLVVKWRQHHLMDGWLWVGIACAIPNGVAVGVVVTFFAQECLR